MFTYSSDFQCILRFTHSSDAAFEKYRCAIFKGFVISVSGMDGEERQHVRNLVEQNGQWKCVKFASFIIISILFDAVFE